MADQFSAWGPEQSGTRLAEQDIIANQRAGLEAQRMLGQIALQPAQKRLAEAHANLYESQAAEQQHKVAAMERLRQEVQGVELEEDSPLDNLYKLTGALVRAGDVTKAGTLLNIAGQTVGRLATAERATAVADAENVKSVIRRNNYLRNALSAAKSPEGWEAMNARYEQQFGEESPYRNTPFTPETAAELGEQALTANQRLTAELKQLEEKGRKAGREDMAEYRRQQIEVQRQRNRIAQERQEQLAKTGRPTGNPTAADLEATEKMLKKDFPDLDDKGKLAVRDIASRARELRRDNRALGQTEAIQRAINEAKASGEFEDEVKLDLPFIGKIGKKTKYTSLGQDRNKPIAMPQSRSDLRRGRWYNTHAGVLQWNGKDFGDEDDDGED